MPRSCRLVAVMRMQVADLVVDGRTTVGRQPLISWLNPHTLTCK